MIWSIVWSVFVGMILYGTTMALINGITAATTSHIKTRTSTNTPKRPEDKNMNEATVVIKANTVIDGAHFPYGVRVDAADNITIKNCTVGNV